MAWLSIAKGRNLVASSPASSWPGGGREPPALRRESCLVFCSLTCMLREVRIQPHEVQMPQLQNDKIADSLPELEHYIRSTVRVSRGPIPTTTKRNQKGRILTLLNSRNEDIRNVEENKNTTRNWKMKMEKRQRKKGKREKPKRNQKMERIF